MSRYPTFRDSLVLCTTPIKFAFSALGLPLLGLAVGFFLANIVEMCLYDVTLWDAMFIESWKIR